MPGGLLEKELEQYLNQTILVITDDGLAFLGELKDFDSETLILEEVYQTSAKDINWKNTDISDFWTDSVKIREVKQKSSDEVGVVEWVKIDLERLYVRIEHVVRIWYESEFGQEGNIPSQTTVYKKD